MLHFRCAEIKESMQSSPHRVRLHRSLTFDCSNPSITYKNNTHPVGWVLFLWRSRRDLNPRYPFGVHTISSRARYDHFDTAPWVRHSCRLAYDTTTALICQVVFLLFSFIFANRVREVILRGFSLKNARRNVEGSLIIYPSVEIRGIRIRFFESINRNKKWETTKVVSHFWSECRDSNSRPLEPHSSAIPNFATPGYRRSDD